MAGQPGQGHTGREPFGRHRLPYTLLSNGTIRLLKQLPRKSLAGHDSWHHTISPHHVPLASGAQSLDRGARSSSGGTVPVLGLPRACSDQTQGALGQDVL